MNGKTVDDVTVLQTVLEHQSAVVNFEAVQFAPPLGPGEAVGVRGASIVVLPPAAPRGMFRPGVAAGF